MAVLYGPGDLKDRTLPVGWDASELEKLRTETNISIAEIQNLVVGAVAALNGALIGDPFYSQLIVPTTDVAVEYRVGTTNAVTRYTEYGPADEQRGDTTGHMLPLLDWDYPLGWTWKRLRNIRMAQVDADIESMIQAWRDRWEKSILTRFFQSADDSGASKGLGSSGYSPAFAHAAASTAVDFTPPPFEGKTFDSDHEHFDATNSVAAADWQAAIDAMTLDLAEHGHEPPFVTMVSYADQGTIEDLTDFRPRPQPEIRYGSTQDLAQVGEMYTGAVSTPSGVTLIKVLNRIPQYSMGSFKAYPGRNVKKSLAARYSEGMGLVVNFLAGKAYREFPIEQLLTYGEFGVGVQDRTNGVCHQMNTASYSDPTIT